MKRLITLTFFFFTLSFIFPYPTSAVTCTSIPVSGDHSITTACNFNGTIDGVDAGTGDTNTATLTVDTGGSLTINNGQTIAVGSISLTGGSITIIDGSVTKLNTPIFLTDADADGYPLNTTQYTSSDTNLVRRNTLSSLTLDCDDGSYSATNSCCTSHQHCDTCYDTCCEQRKTRDDCGCNSNVYSCVGYCWTGSDCSSPSPEGTYICEWCEVNFSCNPYSCNCYTHCH